MTQVLPQFNADNFDAEIVADIEWVKTFITAIRNLRAEYDIAPSQGLEVMIKVADEKELMIPMAGLIDKDAELARLDKEVAKTHGEIKRIEGKLGNEGFVAKAPEAVIAKEREKLDGYKEMLVKLEEQKATIAAL